jgi:hypothetical protein
MPSTRKALRRLRVIQDRPTKFPKGETFRACATGRNNVTTCFDPAPTIASAMSRAKEACTSGKSVIVRGQFTSDGSKWKNHGGRAVASCDNKRWQIG